MDVSCLCGVAVSCPFGTDVAGVADKHEFKAETRNLLNIVAKSLYSDREVREQREVKGKATLGGGKGTSSLENNAFTELVFQSR